jgi:pimeloyl-ACP methyl ester carboxylesterase
MVILDQAQRTVMVDGIRTHYFDLGTGPPVVLLHSGEFGADAATSWEFNMAALAAAHRVIAPDWLGFGGTDKLHDFGGGKARRLWHLRRFLEVLDITAATFIGSSMGATALIQSVASTPSTLPATAAVICSGGGFVPDNEARRTVLSYDGTLESMRAILRVLFYDQRFAEDEAYLRRRHEASILPGAWEAVAAARFRSPLTPPRSTYGADDHTAYEQVAIPTLAIAGENDTLRNPGYAEEMIARIPGAELCVFTECGHLPNIEKAAEFNELVLDFLRRHRTDAERACTR